MILDFTRLARFQPVKPRGREFRIWNLEFRIWNLEFGISDLEFGIWNVGFGNL